MEDEELNEEENENEENTEELVTVFSTDHPGIIAIVKSILDEASIQYLVKGDGLQILFALGTVVFQVMPDNVDMARELLKDVRESDPLTGDSFSGDISDYTDNLPEGFDENANPENGKEK